MTKQPRWQIKSPFYRNLLILTLGLFVYLTDNVNFTSASSFEGSGAKPSKRRLANTSKPVLDIDCASLEGAVSLNTELEAVRLEAKNCVDESFVIQNTEFKQRLVTFPMGKNHYSSEFAYLARGENSFMVTSGRKQIKVSVFRH